MKSFLAWMVFLLNSYSLFSQTTDSASSTNQTTGIQLNTFDSNQRNSFTYRSEKQKRFVVKGNTTFVTYNLIPSPLESEISDLEARECTALLKRDNATLTTLWARDFTLDETANGLVNGTNSLPYYASFNRMVEKFSAFDNVVFTSGYESFQELKPDGTRAEVSKRNFSHTWTRKSGVWKLTTYTHN